MTVALSPLFNGWQGFSISGLPLAGGLLNTYSAGTTTPLATFTDNTGGTPNANPIQLDAAGLPPNEIWLTSGTAYKFVLTDSLGLNARTFDNVSAPDAGGLATSLAASSGSSLVGWIQAGVGAVIRTLQSKVRELISSADFNNTRGTDNWGFGTSAIASMQPAGAGTGVDNLGIGTNALSSCTAGFGNTALGRNALKTLTTPCYSTAVGAYALEHADQPGNINLICTAVGAYALNQTVSGGQYNTAVGGYAGQQNTTGFFNTYVGQNAGTANTTGVSNVGIGHAALLTNIGSRNVAVGDASLQIATGVSDCIAIGFQALTVNLTGTQSTAIGTNALATSTVGNNLAIGYFAGQSLQTGTDNAVVGTNAAITMSGAASRNTSLGSNTLKLLTSNSDNTAVGANALAVSVNGGSTAVGSGALALQTNGGAHAAFGTGAGANVTTGANTLCIGNQAGTDAVQNVTTGSNVIVIGNNSHTNAFIKIALTVTSDARDKTAVASLDRGLDFVMAMKPKSFQLMDRETQQATTGKRFGFIAQDLQALEGDDLVLVDATDAENLKFRETLLIPILVKAIQELRAEVAALKS